MTQGNDSRKQEKDERVEKGIVFDIQRFSLHDGYGIRTLVFMKGCPLRCPWCSNPESQKPEPQLGFFPEKCSFCLKCVDVCPYGEEFKNNHSINWDKCKNCLKCVDACLYEARISYGKYMTVNEVLDIVRRDKVFYDKSNGGVTIGGGEATFQSSFTKKVLKACKEEDIHTALETCGFTSPEKFRDIIQYVDLLLFDLKHMDTNKHKEKTGVVNKVILNNAKMASRVVKEMIVRFPLIPDFNDDLNNIEKMGRFITKEMPSVKRIDVLPYHSTGESKNNIIGKQYNFSYDNELTEERIDEIKNKLKSFGLKVSIGG